MPRQQAGVREAVVMAREHMPGDTRLAAYVVPTGEPAPATGKLRDCVKGRLPDYMVLSAFVSLGALPRTPNGKVDRRALPKPDQARLELEAAFVAPGTPLEVMLSSIWADVLAIERVGIHDNFFALGGHSLLATQVMSRMRDVFQVELPLYTLFEKPITAQLARVITQSQADKAEREDLTHLSAELETLSDAQAQRLLTDESKKADMSDGSRSTTDLLSRQQEGPIDPTNPFVALSP